MDGAQGEQGPAGQDGEDGNANVSQYIFDGHDFTSDPGITLEIPDMAEEALTQQSAWLVYFVDDEYVDSVPGTAVPHSGTSEYSVFRYYDSLNETIEIMVILNDGPWS